MLVLMLVSVMFSCHAVAVSVLSSAVSLLGPLCSLHTPGTLGGFVFPAVTASVAKPHKGTQSHFVLEKGASWSLLLGPLVV